jgi:hypothetical protein
MLALLLSACGSLGTFGSGEAICSLEPELPFFYEDEIAPALKSVPEIVVRVDNFNAKFRSGCDAINR